MSYNQTSAIQTRATKTPEIPSQITISNDLNNSSLWLTATETRTIILITFITNINNQPVKIINTLFLKFRSLVNITKININE